MLDSFNRLPYNYQSKIRSDTLIQNVLLEKFIIIMGTTITDLDQELKLEISRIKNSESKKLLSLYVNLILLSINGGEIY